jgi:hypothetical protein
VAGELVLLTVSGWARLAGGAVDENKGRIYGKRVVAEAQAGACPPPLAPSGATFAFDCVTSAAKG